jgi:hypothetical protein
MARNRRRRDQGAGRTYIRDTTRERKADIVSTQILEQPVTKDADTSPEMFHYVRKEKIAESAVMGTYVVALCGEKFPVTKTPKPGSPVCPQCKEIYESMKV